MTVGHAAKETYQRADYLHIEIEGRDAFRAHVDCNECPYAFNKTPCWPKDYARFDAEYRAKLNAWMHGWMNERDRKAGR